MIFHQNPWIDPRVERVRVADFQNYLLQRGWRPIPETLRGWLSFEIPGDPASLIRIPAMEDGRDYLRFVVDVLTDMAQVEGKYAGDILNDILGTSAPAGTSGNGAVAESAVVSSPV